MTSPLHDFAASPPTADGQGGTGLRLAGTRQSPRASPAGVSTPQSGGFDVKPSDLYRVSTSTAAAQQMQHQGVSPFLEELAKHSEAGGAGSAATDFATAYTKVAARFFDVYAKSVLSVGGAAIGFTTTANNYVKANAASDPKSTSPPATRPEPNVIRTARNYGPVTPLSWNTSGEDDFISSVLDGIDTGLWAVFRELLQHACRWGRAADVMPLPNYVKLAETSFAWQMPMTTLGRTEGTLVGEVGSITDQSNSEWYSAMRAFCSSLWGTTAWGKSRQGYEWAHDNAAPNGATEPVFAVLQDTARGIKIAVHDYAQEAERLRDELRRIYYDAVLEAIPNVTDGIGLDDFKKLGKTLLRGAGNLGAGITLNLDTPAMEAAVSQYERRLGEHTSTLNDLLPALDEAHRSAPTFRAEEARAQAFGARSLHEFKKEHTYQVEDDSRDNHYFPIDLASQEGIHGSHNVDRHVGQTDQQLAQRLRDQGIRDASSFTDLESAQKLTQRAIDQEEDRISDWIDRVERRAENNPNYDPNSSKLQPPVEAKFSHSTGYTVSRDDYNHHGLNAPASETNGVKVVLKYKEGLDPPFVALTSMPIKM